MLRLISNPFTSVTSFNNTLEAATRALDHFGFIPMIASKASPSKLIRGLLFAKQTSKPLYQVVHVAL
jgi:hypothetical protein